MTDIAHVDARPNSLFEPDPPDRASERQSCEYRIGVYFLSD